MTKNRPLSPHLSIHKKVLSAVFSIFHRLTGFGLSIGSIFIALWVAMIALGPNYFIIFQSISSFIVFKILLFIWTVGIFFHLFNGIRYLYWSFGIGMELKTINNSSYFVLLLTILSTIIVWITL
tara:strand:+ start:71 stop:442 length:372 start_codon:yes stop_codon:yes gene_type:complete